MSRIFKWLTAVFFFLSLSACEDTNIPLATEAGLDVIKAVTLSSSAVKQLAVRAAEVSDQKHHVAAADSPYAVRLVKLVGKHQQDEEYTFNYKVYQSKEINAFAMADGSIRLHSKLMDVMSDDELRFIIGHEMGHVVKKHIRKKIMLAYAGSALRKGIASQENLAGDIARSSLGGFTEKLFNAQFSQQEEREADDYGLLFLQREKYDSGAAVSALRKLAQIGNNHSIFSSHPDPESRADRLERRQQQEPGLQQVSIWERIKSVMVSVLQWLLVVVKNFAS